MGSGEMTNEEIFELAETYGEWDDFGRWTFKDDDKLLAFVLAVQEAEKTIYVDSSRFPKDQPDHKPGMVITAPVQAIAEDKWEPQIFRCYSPTGDLISITIKRTPDGEREQIHPPKRDSLSWVGFTHEELAWLNEALNLGGRLAVIEAIEAKLKEKNT
jgi:hypothetical protein